MSPVPKEQVDQVKSEIRSVLGKSVSDLFLHRVDVILDDWSAGKYAAADAFEKVQKLVSLFIDQDKAQEIGSRLAPLVTRESVSGKSSS